MSLNDFSQHEINASCGQGINQSKIQQLIKAGNFLIRILKFSPTGLVQNKTCKLLRVFSTKISYVKLTSGC